MICAGRLVMDCITYWLQATNGQLISKYLFVVFHSPKKQTKTIQLEVNLRYHSFKVDFFLFVFLRVEGTKKTFRNQLTFSIAKGVSSLGLCFR